MAKPQAGFTIIELLIVIVVIAILAAITLVAYNGIANRAQLSALQTDWSKAEGQIEAFKVTNEVYPVSISDCPSPASTNLCLQASPGNTYQYTTYPAAASGYMVSSTPQWSLAVMGNGQVYLRSKATFTGANEFMQYIDLAPIFDAYGLKKYQLSFDIKSANTTTKNTANAYQQNGSTSRYGGPNVAVPVTTSWARQSLQFTPALVDSSTPKSMLAFYGTYTTGNIVSISNLELSIVK